eukprot:1061285-Prymnesium_polylepis.1
MCLRPARCRVSSPCPDARRADLAWDDPEVSRAILRETLCIDASADRSRSNGSQMPTRRNRSRRSTQTMRRRR